MTSTTVLMITYDHAEAVRRSLPVLLDTIDDDSEVWLWHNGTDEETLETTRKFAEDNRVTRFHHSVENVGLRVPTNWLWSESASTYVSKVDDDCILSPHWLDTLRTAHGAWDGFGAIGSWRHYPDEFLPDVGGRKIEDYPGGHRLMRNHWVQGSGHLIKRADTEAFGLLSDRMSFTDWCIRAARGGRHNGFYYPFIFEDHMDDPRSANSLITSDAELLERMPLSAARNSVRTLAEWNERNRRAAVTLQSASLDIRAYYGWRRKRTHAIRRVKNGLSGRHVTW